MNIYHVKRTQLLPVSIDEAWKFFCNPKNLSRITPTSMGFRILYVSGGEEAYAGQIIEYRIKVMPGIVVKWVTEITQMRAPEYFVDEQRFGPYSFWHHQHHFKKKGNSTEMIDEVNYAIPLGIVGRLANSAFVSRQVNAIFDYRSAVLAQLFADQHLKSST